MTSARKDPRFLVIGAGMSGILSAIELRKAGYDDFVIYEKADRLGGTWRENTYPGIACDVPSHFYSYSFAPNPEWSHRFAPGAEIQAYFEDVAHRYEVASRIRFGKEVTRCAFEDGRWKIAMADGSKDAGDFVIAATGVLHHPAYPDIEGLECFAGACFHSARWNHDIALAGKRVGVIGTGSSAIQIVSALVGEVAELLFQRTPQWVAPPRTPLQRKRRRSSGAARRCRRSARKSRAPSPTASRTSSSTRSRPFSRRSTRPAWRISRTTSRTRHFGSGSARATGPRASDWSCHRTSTTPSSVPTRNS
jgi:cation diffusion facilitator CzcD-associated flavoprotein CzcO